MDKIKVYVVDNNELNLDIIKGVIEEFYDVSYFSSAQSCIDEFDFEPADIVLLDVDIPEMDGLESCRRIIEIEPLCSVIFISSKVSDEYRIASYDAGAYDYILKPYNAQMLLKKINFLNKGLAYRAELTEEKDNITTAFMDAITSSGEQGIILHFASNVFDVKTYQELGQKVARAIEQFDVNACIIVEGKQEKVCVSTNGVCSPIEIKTMKLLKNTKRIYEFNGRHQFNEENISILIPSMPDDEDIAGRLCDQLLLLLRIASACVVSLDTDQKNNLLVQELKNVSSVLVKAEQSVRANIFNTLLLLGNEITTIEHEVQSLVLSDEQESRLMLVLQQALIVANNSSDKTVKECDNLNTIVNQITKSL